MVAADVSKVSAAVSPASPDISAATGVAVSAAKGVAHMEHGQQLKVFDVAWRLRNEVIPKADLDSQTQI